MATSEVVKIVNCLSCGQKETIHLKDATPNENHSIKSNTLFCIISSSLGFFINGSFIGWTSYAVDFMDPFSVEKKSQISASFALAAAIGSFFSHRFWHRFGTKSSIIMSNILLVSAWMSFMLSQKYWILFGARLCGGFAIGFHTAIIPLYMNDIVASHQRQFCFSIIQMQFVIGVISQYVLRLFENSTTINILPLIITFLSSILMVFMPESPRLLSMRDRHDEARTVLLKHRNNDHEIENDLQLWSAIHHEKNYTSVIKNELGLAYALPIFGLVIFEQLIGAIPILFYFNIIFTLIGGEFEPETMTILCGLIFLSGIVMQNFTNFNNALIKGNLIWSSNIMGIVLGALGTFCHFQGSFSLQYTEDYRYIPFILISLFYLTFSIGTNRLTNEYIDQVIPKKSYFTIRCLLSTLSWFIIYVLTRMLPKLIYNVGVGWLFWFMSSMCFFMGIFIRFFLPSTNQLCENFRLVDSSSSETYSDA